MRADDIRDGVDDLLDGYGFVRPSFVGGFASLVDLSGSLSAPDLPSDGAEADARAIASDWAAVGRDLGAAMGQAGPKAMASPGRRRGRVGRKNRSGAR